MCAKIVPVILAGGAGTRLWPLSRKNYPKQFLKLIGNHSLFQETIFRIQHIQEVKESIIVTNASHAFLCTAQMKEAQLKNGKLILEPCSRNTAPAIALAAQAIVETSGVDTLMLALPADHLIGDPKAFAHLIRAATPTAKNGHLVTFGIIPTAPKTGYGYIQAGEQLDQISFAVKQFTEKPNKKKAETFLKAQNYFWNSGMFFSRAQDYLDQLKQSSPLIYKSCLETYAASKQDKTYFHIDKKRFKQCPSDSIDYAVMEKTNLAAVIPLKLPWSDLGCWVSVADAGNSDDKKNVIRGNVITRDCERCFLNSESESLVAAIGIKDQIVVRTDDAVLVADKKYAQEVKNLVNELKATNQTLITHHKYVHCDWGLYEKLIERLDFHLHLLMINPKKILPLCSYSALTVIQGEIEFKGKSQAQIISEKKTLSLEEGGQIMNRGKAIAHVLAVKTTN